MDPLGAQFASYYPAPNQQSPLSAPPRDNFVNSASNALTQDFYTGKVDHKLRRTTTAPTDASSSRAIRRSSPRSFQTRSPTPRAGTRSNRHTNVTGAWIHHFSPTLIQDIRINWGRRLHINRSAGRFSGKNGEIGIPGVNPEAFARVAVNGLTTLGAGEP